MKSNYLKQKSKTLKSGLANIKNQKGITLIALVVTIIVLLILAGVSINMVLGNNGIFEKAKDAQNKMNEARDNDLEGINYLNDLLNEYTNGTGTTTPTQPTEKPTITDTSLISDNRTSTESSTVIAKDTKGNQVVVPGGFKISADSGTSVQQGVVIEDADGNQFVWVPVSNIDGSNTNPIILDDGTEKVITLGRYTFDRQYNVNTGKVEGTGESTLLQRGSEYESIVTIESYHQELSTYRESNEKSDFTGTNTTAKKLQEFIEKTKENKGYYIARYEASYGSGYNDSGTTTSEKLANAKPLSKPSTSYRTASDGSMNYVAGTLWNYITQPQASKVSQNMYVGNSYVESDLINSYAWDTAIVYIQAMGNSNYANQNRGSNTSLMDTGSTGDEKCKIFDMAGNLSEWETEYSNSTETFDSYPCSIRGGNYEFNGTNTAYRGGNEPATLANGDISFRTIVYVK